MTDNHRHVAKVELNEPLYLKENVPALFEDKTHLDTLRELEGKHGKDLPKVFKGKDGQDVTLVSSGPAEEGSRRFQWSDGTIQTNRPDGSRRYQYTSGAGFDGQRTADGGWQEKHWGPGPFDNQIRTYWKDDSVRVTSDDGTSGYYKTIQPDNSVKVNSWGTRPWDNYESIWKNRTEFVTYPDGTKYAVPR